MSILTIILGLICLLGLALLVAAVVFVLASNRGSGVSNARQGWISEGSDRRE